MADVLAEVNRMRAKHGIGEPLAEMPKGVPWEGGEVCPLGRALCGCVNGIPRRLRREGHDPVDLPEVLGQFVRAFDNRLYPDIEDNA